MRLKKITLKADVMFVNKILFLGTFGRNIGLLTVDLAVNRMGRQLAENLMNVVRLYKKAGYEVETVLMDMEFDKIKGILPQFNINTSTAQ